MCIIVYKPGGAAAPSKKILQNCFFNNSDGAGFMYSSNGVVCIHKGFNTFNDFWKALKISRSKTGDGVPYVYHFRISTQAGTRPDCTHPFPLSPNMNDLRLLDCTASVGVAHNGIIYLTSEYYTKVNYSDTMKFITDYLYLIIDNDKWYESENKIALISRLTGSKLAILDGFGHCELIGDFIERDGIYYSNTSFQIEAAPKVVTVTTKATATKAAAASFYDNEYFADDIDYNNGTMYGERISAYNCAYEYTGEFSGCEFCEDCERCHDYISTYDYYYGRTVASK